MIAKPYIRFINHESPMYAERLALSKRKAMRAFNRGEIVANEFASGWMGVIHPNMDSSAWNGLQGRFYRFPGLGHIQHQKSLQIAS